MYSMWKRREHFVYSKYTWKKEKKPQFSFKGFKRLLLWT